MIFPQPCLNFIHVICLISIDFPEVQIQWLPFYYQDMAAFKIAGLQKALEESIPAVDLEQANKKYHELTEKYRDLLEKGNNLVLKAEMLTGLEVSTVLKVA